MATPFQTPSRVTAGGRYRRGLKATPVALTLSPSLVARVERFFSTNGRAIKGYRSQLVTQLITDWINTNPAPAYGSGTRQTFRGEKTVMRWDLNLPTDLLDKLNIFCINPKTNAPIYGFKKQLIEKLLLSWVEAREAELETFTAQLKGTK